MGLGDLAFPRRHRRWAQPLADEHPRIVEIDDLRLIVQLERSQCEGQSPPAQERGLQALGAETR